jgi:hypothetical protein
MARGTILIAVVAAVSGGCSVVLVQGPTRVSRDDYVAGQCTTNQAAPVVDMLITGVQAVRTVIAVNETDEDYRDALITRDFDVAIGAMLTAAFAGSAIYGFVTTSHCRELRGGVAVPMPTPGPRRPPLRSPSERTAERRAEEAAEEAAVRARAKAMREASEKAQREDSEQAPTPDAGASPLGASPP